MKLAEFDYELPSELIAQFPAAEREQSRLLVARRDNQTLTHTTFTHLPEFLTPSDVLVVNNTKVIPARLLGVKHPGGGKIELFLIRQRQGTEWEVLIRGKVKVGATLHFGAGRLVAMVQAKDPTGKCLVTFTPQTNLPELLTELGAVPLPPYIKRPQGVLPADSQRYQTVYAQAAGAVAAPTAGLHFSEQLLQRIQAQGVQIVTVTLHVGPGTFQPVKVDQIEHHQVLPEWYELSAEAAQQLAHALRQRQRIIAVGTTTTRLLEAVYLQNQALHPGSGWADLFIYPDFRFQVIQALITNFHLPCSSLLMLVSAFGGLNFIRQAYRTAIAERYRFYSYGDAMLIL
jgi:S-adenosylmethionine:tRNA ribosyltransferase-isomerase